ncbi:MAG: DUF2752 domain-containing protein [Oscillospiraceae bacterium]|nr:DUF2752 domain-containing protein [Oscillospiraceae bacterium]
MKIKRLLITIFPVIAAFGIYLCMKLFCSVMSSVLYICPVFLVTGLYCPGCGGTRAVKALLDGRFLTSLIDNPSVITILLILLLLYVEKLLQAYGKNIKIIPRSKTFWYVLSGIFVLFYIARNFIGFLMPR